METAIKHQCGAVPSGSEVSGSERRKWDGVECARELARNGVEVWALSNFHEAYEVSNLGRVWSKRRGRCLKLKTHSKSGYVFTSLGAKITKNVHVLVLGALDGPAPEGARAWRANQDRADNRLCNLEWRRGRGRRSAACVFPNCLQSHHKTMILKHRPLDMPECLKKVCLKPMAAFVICSPLGVEKCLFQLFLLPRCLPKK